MLKCYRNTPLGIGTEIDQNDYFLGDGATTKFFLKNKNYLRLANAVQAKNTQYLQSTGSVILDTANNAFSLPVAPALNDNVIAPGVTRHLLSAYDNNSIDGFVGNPRLQEKFFIVADVEEIALQYYLPTVGQTGIKVQFVDKDPSASLIASWVSLAPMNPDGTAGTYGAPGVPLILPPLQGVSMLTANTAVLDTVINVMDGSQFQVGEFIAIDYGLPTFEAIRVTAIAGNVLTTKPLSKVHTTGAFAYECGWPVYSKLLIPSGGSGGEQINLYNLGIDLLCDIIDR